MAGFVAQAPSNQGAWCIPSQAPGALTPFSGVVATLA